MKQPKVKVFGGKRNGSWVGIVGEVYNKLYDFTISDLSVTQQRSEVYKYLFKVMIFFKNTKKDSFSLAN